MCPPPTPAPPPEIVVMSLGCCPCPTTWPSACRRRFLVLRRARRWLREGPWRACAQCCRRTRLPWGPKACWGPKGALRAGGLGFCLAPAARCGAEIPAGASAGGCRSRGSGDRGVPAGGKGRRVEPGAATTLARGSPPHGSGPAPGSTSLGERPPDSPRGLRPQEVAPRQRRRPFGQRRLRRRRRRRLQPGTERAFLPLAQLVPFSGEKAGGEPRGGGERAPFASPLREVPAEGGRQLPTTSSQDRLEGGRGPRHSRPRSLRRNALELLCWAPGRGEGWRHRRAAPRRPVLGSLKAGAGGAPGKAALREAPVAAVCSGQTGSGQAAEAGFLDMLNDCASEPPVTEPTRGRQATLALILGVLGTWFGVSVFLRLWGTATVL